MQLSDDMVVDPFGEVNVFSGSPGMIRVRATILMAPSVENAAVALATDASRSMLDNFGGAGLSAIFKKENQVELVARTMAEYLANFSGDGKVSLAYWAVGTAGAHVIDLGRVDAAEAATKSFQPPQNMGTGTMLLPAVKHFADGAFKASKWAMVVFITDGVLDDLQAVKDYTLKLAREIADGKRGFLKLVLIGIGADCDESQMEELDDLLDDSGIKDPTGNDVDLWDHSMAANMKSLAAIFKEVVSRNTIVASSATIVDDRGAGVRSDTPFTDGLPAIFEFEMPAGSGSFTLTLPDGQKFVQPVK